MVYKSVISAKEKNKTRKGNIIYEEGGIAILHSILGWPDKKMAFE